MPVLPDVGSMIVAPGDSNPSFSAASIMKRAARSLIEPVGLRSSSLAHRRTSADGDSLGRPTSGVCPTESRRSRSARSPVVAHARRCPPATAGQDRHRVAVLHRCLQPAHEPNVLVVDVHVDEPAQAAFRPRSGREGRDAGSRGRPGRRRACHRHRRRPSLRRCTCAGSSGCGPRWPCRKSPQRKAYRWRRYCVLSDSNAGTTLTSSSVTTASTMR